MLWEVISSFLAWVILVPLLILTKDKSSKYVFWFSYLYGFIFFLITIYWIYHVTVLGLILLVAYLALYFGIFGFVVSRYSQLSAHSSSLFLIPALWVSLEYIRTYLFTGFGWALLGYSQYRNLPIIQIADVTGVYGVSFLIVMANVAIARRKVSYIIIALMIIGLSFVYGHYKLDHQLEGHKIRISIVQGNVPQEEKWDEAYKEGILTQYVSLTKESVKDLPDLIIWPETSAPGIINADTRLNEVISDLAKGIDIPLLVGAPSLDVSGKYRNSAILFSEKGDVLRQYDKLHLVPFGEFIPFEKELPFFRKLIVTGDFVPGNEWTLFTFQPTTYNLSPTTFGVLICFEDIFPDLVRGFVSRGADFMVNITNDAWFKKTPAPYQHAQASVFRAVENKISIVRSANTGLSCFISPIGKITESVKDDQGDEIFVSGYKTSEVIFRPRAASHESQVTVSRTFYTRYGDIFAWLCVVVSLIAVFGRRFGALPRSFR